MITYDRPIVWSIAGFDPTGGAGILADVKTFEQNGTLGMAFLSSTTIQRENEFISVEWLSADQIRYQLEPLAKDYEVNAVKIGIIQSVEILKDIVSWLKGMFPKVKIVWDPVLAASSGFELLETRLSDELITVLRLIDLVTPNVYEARRLTGEEDEIEAAFKLGEYSNVLLKGGHSAIRQGMDLLIENRLPIEITGVANTEKCSPKHGSGCILSSAIASNLALGFDLTESCRNAKKYVESRLMSNTNLLSFHAE